MHVTESHCCFFDGTLIGSACWLIRATLCWKLLCNWLSPYCKVRKGFPIWPRCDRQPLAMSKSRDRCRTPISYGMSNLSVSSLGVCRVATCIRGAVVATCRCEVARVTSDRRVEGAAYVIFHDCTVKFEQGKWGGSARAYFSPYPSSACAATLSL